MNNIYLEVAIVLMQKILVTDEIERITDWILCDESTATQARDELELFMAALPDDIATLTAMCEARGLAP